MPISSLHRPAHFVAGIGMCALMVTACSSSSSTPSTGHTGATTRAGTGVAPVAPGGSSAKAVDGCTLITSAQLSAAVGVRYTAIQDGGGGSSCNVTGASPADSFIFWVRKEAPPLDTWSAQLAAMKQDDGTLTSVPGIGDRAVEGFKEFTAEYKGQLVVVINADVNNPSTAKAFTRTKKIAKFVISKL